MLLKGQLNFHIFHQAFPNSRGAQFMVDKYCGIVVVTHIPSSPGVSLHHLSSGPSVERG